MVKSKFWRGSDLRGVAPVVLTISDVTEELLGGGGRKPDVKCFLWFQEHLKGLQLNKTRVAILESAYGPDSDLWVGKRVRLSFDPTVMMAGQAVGGVRLQTPPGVIYTPGAGAHPGWGEAPAAVPGRPPAPVWDDQRQAWITPQPPAAATPVHRPPAPVWNEAQQKWETVDPATGEIAAPVHRPPPTISERVNAGNPPATDGGWGAAAPAGAPEFDDDIPF
jgi:hypothetical protein